jgi:hypothetical protein
LLIQFELFELIEHLSYIYEHFSLTSDHMFYFIEYDAKSLYLERGLTLLEALTFRTVRSRRDPTQNIRP